MLRRDLLVQALGGSVVCLATGCGTIFHKERINRPHSRDIDWKIVALNGLGLLFFFVPGVIAFAVDFHTGAIYLPPEEVMGFYPGQAAAIPIQPGGQFVPTEWTAMLPPKVSSLAASPVQPASLDQPSVPPAQTVTLHKVPIQPEQIDRAALETRLGQHLGRPVQLDGDSTRVSSMKQLADFSTHRRQHSVDRSFGQSIRQFFRELRPA